MHVHVQPLPGLVRTVCICDFWCEKHRETVARATCSKASEASVCSSSECTAAWHMHVCRPHGVGVHRLLLRRHCAVACSPACDRDGLPHVYPVGEEWLFKNRVVHRRHLKLSWGPPDEADCVRCGLCQSLRLLYATLCCPCRAAHSKMGPHAAPSIC